MTQTGFVSKKTSHGSNFYTFNDEHIEWIRILGTLAASHEALDVRLPGYFGLFWTLIALSICHMLRCLGSWLGWLIMYTPVRSA